MDTTPKSKKTIKRLNLDQGKDVESSSNTDSATSTPINRRSISTLQLDDSPVYFASSQNGHEQVDVFWDWQSPHTALMNERRRLSLKRTIASPVNRSPKQMPPVLKCHSTDNTQNYDKLYEELKALQAQLAQPDDEKSLCVSPLQETEWKQDDHFDDYLNDSINEQMLLLSQQMEEQIRQSERAAMACDTTPNSMDCLNMDDSLDDIFASIPIETEPKHVVEEKSIVEKHKDIIEKNRLQALAKLESKKQNSTLTQKWTRTLSENSFNGSTTSKVEFNRTRSFELDVIKHQPKNLSKNIVEEIEKKRLEALSRREAKRPIQCSPEEIEKKRQEALAKLEAKKRQSLIEKKRQEALRRLELNRLKNAASNVKSTLIKRF